MDAWTHYFTFKRSHILHGHWVEIIAKSSKKATKLMNEIYGAIWDKHYNSFTCINLKWCSKGCLARHEVE